MNEGLIENLKILHKYYQKHKDVFRSRAYYSAIGKIQKFPRKISTVKDINELFPTKSSSIRAKVEEYLQTGEILKVIEIKKLFTPKDKVIELFKSIHGIGAENAEILWDAGYRTIADLKKIKHKLTSAQKIGLKYHGLLKPIKRDDILVFQAVVRFVLNKAFGKNTYNMMVAGSYRRRKPVSGDIDILLTSKHFDLKQAVDVLNKSGIIVDNLTQKGKMKFMGIGSCIKSDGPYFRVDIEFVSKDEWAPALLYFTGSARLNEILRLKAKKNGMLLNEHGLFKNGVKLPLYTEKSIFKALGEKYLKPEDR